MVNTFPEDFLLDLVRSPALQLSLCMNKQVGVTGETLNQNLQSFSEKTYRKGVPPVRSLTEVEDIGRPET